MEKMDAHEQEWDIFLSSLRWDHILLREEPDELVWIKISSSSEYTTILGYNILQ